MHFHFGRQQMKSAMLPIAMIGGAVLYKWIGYLTFLSPYLIFAMLFITYCKLNLRDLRPSKAQLLLLCIQMAIATSAYFLISLLNGIVAEGVFICVFIPTATAAPVITAMLGGSISFVATYSLLCNALVAIVGPFVLAAIGDNANLNFMQSMLLILSKVAPLLILPMVFAFFVRRFIPSIHKKVSDHQQLSFYIWAISLFIIVGSCVSFVIKNYTDSALPLILGMVGGSFVVCILQFFIGRRVGLSIARDSNVAGDNEFIDCMKVSCAQSLMQKNTVLGVWLAMAYMSPLASVAPAAYIAWHNMVNSWQIMRHHERIGTK